MATDSNNSLPRNGFQHKLMTNGMKNLGVKFLYRIKFQVQDGSNTAITSGSAKIAEKFNNHNGVEFVYFSRGISGLPKFEVKPIEDNFFIYTQQVPGKPENKFPPLIVNFIAKETGEPILNFLSEINKLTRLQGKDFRAKTLANENANNYDDNKADASVLDVSSTYTAANFANNDTKNIFFTMTVSALEYGTYKPWMTYKFNNCWIAKVDLGDEFKETDNALIAGKLNIMYDFPEVLFYKNNEDITGTSTSTSATTIPSES